MREALLGGLLWAGWATAGLGDGVAPPLPSPLTLEHALGLADAPHPLIDQANARLEEARAEQRRVDAIDDVKVDVELAARFIEPSFRGKVLSQTD